MSSFDAILLGIIEGITEFLPISSTAHLQIASWILSLEQTAFLKSFEIAIQLGAILAVVAIYFSVLKKNVLVWKRILIAFIPTAVVGLVLYKIIKDFLFGNFPLMIVALGVGGIAIILFEYRFGKKAETQYSITELETLSYTKAFVIGCAQALAVVPGVSRSAATVIAGRAVGMTRKAIVDFSFLLAIPTMFAATGYDLYKNAAHFSSDNFKTLAIGFIVAFIAAYIAVKGLLKFIQNHNFTFFGYYRIVLAIALILFFW